MRAPSWLSCATMVVLLSPALAIAQQPAAPPTATMADEPAPTPPPAAPPPPAATTQQPPPPAATTQPPPPPPPGAYPYPYPPPYPYPYPPPGYYPPQAPPPPAELDYEEGQEVPPGYRVESRVRRGPIIAGTIMFSVTYGINLLAASFADDNDSDASWLYVPGVGSWPLVSDACERNNDGCEVLILHSLTHTIGLALIVYGVAAPKKRLVREASIDVVPMTYAGGGGLGVLGAF